MKRRPLETAAVATARNESMNVQQAHYRLGHISEEATRKTAKALGWTLSQGL
jgi:hypothetical protein